jgi:hypothetical protein
MFLKFLNEQYCQKYVINTTHFPMNQMVRCFKLWREYFSATTSTRRQLSVFKWNLRYLSQISCNSGSWYLDAATNRSNATEFNLVTFPQYKKRISSSKASYSMSSIFISLASKWHKFSKIEERTVKIGK